MYAIYRAGLLMVVIVACDSGLGACQSLWYYAYLCYGNCILQVSPYKMLVVFSTTHLPPISLQAAQ